MARRPENNDEYAQPRKKRRWGKVLAWLLVLVVVFGGAAVLVDMGARDFAEKRAVDEIKGRLPAGSSDVAVSIGGFSFLQQVVSGSLDDVDVSFELSQEALSALAAKAGLDAQLRLSDKLVHFDSQIDILGIPLGFTVTAEPSLDAGYLVLTATAVEAAAGGPAIDLQQFVELGTLGTKFCVAEALPESIHLSKLTVLDGTLRVEAVGSSVPVDLDKLMTKESCA